jgi:hypothetical protein
MSMTTYNHNSDLGSETELAELVQKVSHFDYDTATSSDHLALAKALRVLADDVLRRHADAVTLQGKLRDQLSSQIAVSEITQQISYVVKSMKPARKRWWFQ